MFALSFLRGARTAAQGQRLAFSPRRSRTPHADTEDWNEISFGDAQMDKRFGLRSRMTVLLAVLCGAVAASPADAPPYVNSRELVFGYALAESCTLGRAGLWVTQDDGRSWRAVEVAAAGGPALRYSAAGDGRFGFWLVVENEGGSSAIAPTPGDRPQIQVIVDTVPPLVQLHAARVLTIIEAEFLELDATVIEENLGPQGLHLFWRPTAGGAWQDGGVVRAQGGAWRCPLPQTDASHVNLRLRATDLAGNASAAELANIVIASVVPPCLDAIPADAEDSLAAAAGADSAAALASPGAARAAPLAPGDEQLLTQWRRLAREHLSQGRYELAAARLTDMLSLMPNEADLHVELGSALLRLERVESANAHFATAHTLSRDNSGALEGLALVAASQGRFPQAAEQLELLLKLRPDSAAHWLRYGDLRHKLGDNGGAEQAWRKALEFSGGDAALAGKCTQRLEIFSKRSAR